MADKHIRLDAHFNLIGAFWEPAAPDAVIPGTLTSGEDTITFTTAPKYSRKIAIDDLSSLMRFGPPERIETLHGFTEEGLCTLLGLTHVREPGITDFRVGQAITAKEYRVWRFISGMHINGADHECLTAARYTFSGLSQWLPRAIDEKWGLDSIVLTLPNTDKEIVDFSLRETGTRVSVKLFSELKSSEDDGRLGRSIAYVKVEPTGPKSLHWYLTIGNRLENLFSLLTGASLALETMFVYSGDNSGYVIGKRQSYVSPYEIMESVRCSHSQLANSIAIWLSRPNAFDSIEALVLGVLRKGKLFLETEFLSLAQALEGFHRVTSPNVPKQRAALRQIRKKITALLEAEPIDAALKQRICDSMMHANDPTLPMRLRDLCSRLSDITLSRMGVDPEKFVTDVAVTRNFYTHTGVSEDSLRKKKPSQGKDIFFLNRKMHALLRGLLLVYLGLPEEQISELMVRLATKYR